MSSPPQVIIFGASGDLTARKLIPALASLAQSDRPKEGFSVLGVARRAKTDEEFRTELRAAMSDADRACFDDLAPRIHYQSGDASSDADLAALEARLDSLAGGDTSGRLFYFALKPDLFTPTIRAVARRGLIAMHEAESAAWRRVVIEKPFGQDLPSARALNQDLHDVLREDQIYRIDHYLGKETVQNLLGFRFHNAIFEPLFHRHHVEHVQITVAEEIGVDRGRAGYYDTTGALRDMLQNHILQLLALIAMEAPASLDPETIRSQKIEVLRALHIPDADEARRGSVRARYSRGSVAGVEVPGYIEEEGVPEFSETETYVAVRAEIDSWRWQGVPFFLRHGKRLAKSFTEIQVHFRTPPLALFNRPDGMDPREYRRRLRDGSLCQMRPNVLTLGVQPREAITLSFGVKQPGNAMVMAPADMEFDYREHFDSEPPPAYERLLLDAIVGDQTLFLRAEEIEAAWEYVDEFAAAWRNPDAPQLLEYPAGSWGPEQATDLFVGCEGGWSRG